MGSRRGNEAEEDRRKQEEEKTRQESLKLEQRKIEMNMLQESMRGGIPPHLVPMIFTGIGGGNLGNLSLEWLQQYVAQLQASAQQQQQQQQQPPQHQQQHQTQSQAPPPAPVSPELRRESRLISQGQSSVYGVAPPTPQQLLPPASVLPGQPLATQPQHGAFSTSSYASGGMSPRTRAAQTSGHPGAPTSAPRPPPQSQLPRLSTNEILIQQPAVGLSSVQQLQQAQSGQPEQSSPALYFHHWVPPTSQEKSSSGNPPAAPAGKDKASSSFSSRPRTLSHVSDPDYTSSPKKRKAQGGHQAAPPPPPTARYTSPSYSHVSSSSASTPARRGHARTRSDVSTRGGDSHGGPVTRRGTISSHGPGESSGLQQRGDTPDARFQPPHRGLEGQHQHQQHHPLQQQLYQHEESHSRNEGLEHGQQARVGTPMAIQTETRSSQQHHQIVGHQRGSVPSSPRLEGGRQ